MSLPILTYATYTSLASGDAYFEKLRDFFVTLGWTENEYYQANKQWNTSVPYGWIAGSESWLDVQSNGNGSQLMRYVFKNEHANATCDTLTVGGSLIGNTYSLAATIPINQTSLVWDYHAGNVHRKISIPRGTISKCWFFGNDYCMYSVIEVAVGVNIIWGVGSPTLISEYTTRTDCLYVYMPCRSANSDSAHQWENISTTGLAHWWCGLDYPSYSNSFAPPANSLYAYIEGSGRAYIGSNEWGYLNTWLSRDGAVVQSPAPRFDVMNKAIVLNSYNDIRPIIQPKAYIKHASNNTWKYIGTLPFGNLVSSGCASGDTLTYGSENYLVFPNLLSSWSYGKAFRI